MNRTLRIGLALVLIGLGLVIGVSVVTKGEYFNIGEEEFTYYEETYTSEEFQAFDFDFDNRKIYVLKSEDETITVKYYVNDKEEYELNESSSTLEITVDRKWYNNFFNIGNLINSNYYDVYLYLPETVTAYNLNIATSYGKISVTDTDDLGTVYLYTSYGDIIIDKLNSVSLDLETLYGIIDLQTVSVTGDITAGTSYGDIIIDKLNSVSLDLKTSNGKIDLQTISVTGDITAGTSYGRIILDDVSGDTLIFTTSNGKIQADNILATNLKLSSSNGDIEATVYGDQDNFRIKLATSNGSRYLDGIKVDQSDFNNTQTNYVDIRSSNGTVSLDFITE